MKTKKIYIVKYCGWNYDEAFFNNLFVTSKKNTAIKYVTKFNRILKKWKEHYKQYETIKFGLVTIKDEHFEKRFDRWNYLRNIDRCFFSEIDVR